jgi:hypothetical protein
MEAIKRKFVVKTQDLPSPSSSAQHIVRFKVVSEDRNRASDWSPIFVLNSEGQIPSASVGYILTSASSVSGKSLKLIWSGGYILSNDDLDLNTHDIFVKYDNDSYEYVKTTTGNIFEFIARESTSSARIMVQVPSYPVIPYLSAATGVVRPQTKPILSSVLKILETDTIVY